MEVARQLADRHIAHLQRLAGRALRVTDKMPDNILHLGIIAVLFPAARIIFCRRDMRDNCLSCFFQRFGEGTAFAYDLADCARRCLQIERLAEHWRRVLPLSMLTVDYEALVAEPEGESRRLIDSSASTGSPAASSSIAPAGRFSRPVSGKCGSRSLTTRSGAGAITSGICNRSSTSWPRAGVPPGAQCRKAEAGLPCQ